MVTCSNLVFYYQFIHTVKKYFNYRRIDESDYSIYNFIRKRERQMLKVTKCIGVKSFVEALINMVCELKITSGSKKILLKFHGDPILS